MGAIVYIVKIFLINIYLEYYCEFIFFKLFYFYFIIVYFRIFRKGGGGGSWSDIKEVANK